LADLDKPKATKVAVDEKKIAAVQRQRAEKLKQLENNKLKDVNEIDEDEIAKTQQLRLEELKRFEEERKQKTASTSELSLKHNSVQNLANAFGGFGLSPKKKNPVKEDNLNK
jgi:hypothetical protein